MFPFLKPKFVEFATRAALSALRDSFLDAKKIRTFGQVVHATAAASLPRG
jgi:hypothetical protein